MLNSLLDNLHESIARFSDGNLLIHNENQDEQINSVADTETIIQQFSPPGLEEPFQQLYSVILPNLNNGDGAVHLQGNDENNDVNKTVHDYDSCRLDTKLISSSSAAILMGSKGSGKSLLLERCLEACRQSHSKRRNRPLFHKVSINGILCRGHDVGAVIYEIIRQLSEIAFDSNSYKNNEDNNMVSSSDAVTPIDSTGHKDTPNKERDRKRRRRLKMDKYILRLRRSAYTSNVALLESTLKIANVDGVPILLILDELDAFVEEGQRQMLLYFLLDRVTTSGSNLIFIGITSSFSTLTLLEKRIRSRAEGTAKVIYVRNPATYSDLLTVLQHKLKDCVVRDQILARLSCLPTSSNTCSGHDPSMTKLLTTAHSSHQVSNPSFTTHVDDSNDVLPGVPEAEKDAATRISMTMERELRLGRDLRWYSRVISTALSLYRHECIMASSKVDFHTNHILNALVMLGASIGDINESASQQPDFFIVNDMAVDPRLQSLLNLSTPEVALLLSAKRILIRQSHKDESSVCFPLTMDRMLKELESFRRRTSYVHFSNTMLRKAFLQLLDVGLLMPTRDHSGGGPLQYELSKSYRNLDTNSLFRLPLQIPLEIDRELAKALEQDLLACSTAVKEWGKATS